MEATLAEFFLPQEQMRYPHITKKILESACSSVADFSRFRRVSKAWKNFIDQEFLDDPKIQKIVRKERILHPWRSGKVTKIEVHGSDSDLKNYPPFEKNLIAIDDDSFYCEKSQIRNDVSDVDIFFKEQCVGSLMLHCREIKHLIQLDDAKRLMILLDTRKQQQLLEWTLNSDTAEYEESRKVMSFAPNQVPYLTVLRGFPFVVWTEHMELTVLSIQNSESASIKFHSLYKIKDIHFNDDLDRVFVNMKDEDSNHCVVVADFRDGIREKPSLRIMPGVQSLSSYSEYLITINDEEVEIIDKATLLPIATLTLWDLPDFSHINIFHDYRIVISVFENKLVYCVDNIMKSFDFKSREARSVKLPASVKDFCGRSTMVKGLVVLDSLFILYNCWDSIFGSNDFYHCVDLKHLEYGLFYHEFPDTTLRDWMCRFHKVKRWGHNKIIGTHKRTNTVIIWKFE